MTRALGRAYGRVRRSIGAATQRLIDEAADDPGAPDLLARALRAAALALIVVAAIQWLASG